MRLDRFLSVTNTASRSEAGRAVRRGSVIVNGAPALRADAQIDPENDSVYYLGTLVVYKKYYYIILNKPEGVVSATEDGGGCPVVTDLLPEKYRGVFPCGRLDKYTTGLMLLTNDGETSHRLLSPSRHVKKTYLYDCLSPLSESDARRLCDGVYIEGGYMTKPAQLEQLTPTRGHITLTEGKYHQIKQMFGAVGNKITSLERISFGPLTLDGIENRGDFRELTKEEENALLGKQI